MRILIVEDDEFVSQALVAVLSNYNYAVEIAYNGLSAWELIENFNYDLLLLDIMLPGIDGISLCQQIRAYGRKLPILLLTGRDSSHDKAVGLDAGADDYLVKPFDCEELMARVRALLRRGTVKKQPVLEWGQLPLDPVNCKDLATQNEIQQLSLALEAGEIGIWNWNLITEQLTFFGHERLFGIIPGSFDGTFDTFINCVLESDRESLYLKVNLARLERTKFHHEFRVVWLDGDIHWIEAKGKFYYDDAGEGVQMLGTATDITVRKNIEADLRKSKEELEKRVVERTTEFIWVAEQLLRLNDPTGTQSTWHN